MVNQFFNPDIHLNSLMCAVIVIVHANLRIILNLLSAPFCHLWSAFLRRQDLHSTLNNQLLSWAVWHALSPHPLYLQHLVETFNNKMARNLFQRLLQICMNKMVLTMSPGYSCIMVTRYSLLIGAPKLKEAPLIITPSIWLHYLGPAV